jgi:hypothetical protein
MDIEKIQKAELLNRVAACDERHHFGCHLWLAAFCTGHDVVAPTRKGHYGDASQVLESRALHKNACSTEHGCNVRINRRLPKDG